MKTNLDINNHIKSDIKEAKVLHLKSKSLINAIIQKIFLKILLKLFPRKFHIIKEKVKLIKFKFENFLFLFFKTISLRLKYPSFLVLPNRHIRSLDVLLKFLKILKLQQIDFFLTEGSLLGAVRQEAFAGRPGDIDIGVKEDQFSKLLDSINLLIKNGAVYIKGTPRKKFEKLQIVMDKILIDVSVFRKKIIEGNKMWVCELDKSTITNKNILLPSYDLENLSSVKLYGKNFFAPLNPVLYLQSKYGENYFTIPENQFIWKKNNFFKFISFFSKQIKDIKSVGVSELFRKFYLLIKILPKFISVLMAILPCLLMRLIKPMILIRIEKIPCVNFGDFASFTALYYSKKKLGINQPSKKYIDLLYFDPKDRVSNRQLEKMWRRKLKFFSGHILHPVYLANKLIPGGNNHTIEILSSKFEYDVDNLVDKCQPLDFTPEEEKLGKKILNKFGLKDIDKFVCLAVRDGSYNRVKNSLNYSEYSYHDYRNHDIDNFKLACGELVKRGYFVFRMGVTAEKPLNLSSSKIIDYVNSNLRSDFMDIYLGAKCSFCLSTGYGFDSIPYIFKRPIAIMSLPVGDLRSHSDKFLLLTKHHILKKEKRKLSLSEIFSHGVAFAYDASIFEKKGIDLLDYTSEEIRDFVIEMYEIVESKKRINPEDQKLQESFQSLFALNIKNSNYRAQVKTPYHKLQGQIRSCFFTKFLRENKNWLQ